MVKMCYFEFEEIAVPNHWITFAQFGTCTKSEVTIKDGYRSIAALLPDLGADDAWQISFDQSTTNSGVFLKNYTNTRAIMLECKRGRGEDADNYIFDFEMLIHELCKTTKITHMLYERPISTESYRSSQVLFQLEGMLRQLPRRYPEFSAARIDYIENAAWRAVVVDSKKFAQFERKSQTALSIRMIYPWANEYGQSIGSDQDVFEAMGVMFGWFINSYDQLGRPYVRGDKFNGSIGGFLLPDVSAQEISHAFKEQGLKSVWCVENPKKSIYENIASGLERYQINCVEISNLSAMLAMYVECNRKWTDPEKVTLVVVPANFTDKRLFDITGKEYHFVI